MSVKFIHAADLHIDSPMRGLSAKDTKVAEKVRNATRGAFKALVDYALNRENGISFIVIAGDVFDGDWDAVETGLWTSHLFKDLEDAGIPVYLVFGNHDGKNKILSNMSGDVFPSNVVVFSRKAPERVTFDLGGERFAITGQSYSDWKCPDDLADGYPAPAADAFNIAALHTGLGGESGGAYAPTTVANLRAKGYEYWALGHQHRREVLLDEPGCFIAYSGVLQARHINESVNDDGSSGKGFFVVEVEDGRRVGEPEFVPADSFRWFNVPIDLSDIVDGDTEEDERRLRDLVLNELRAALDDADGRDVAARIRFLGRTSLYGALRNLYEKGDDQGVFDRLRQSIAALGGRIWVEKFDVDELRPLVPEDFWEKGALSEIRGGLLREPEPTPAPASGKGKKTAATILPDSLADFAKKIGGYRTELLYGKKRRNDGEQDPDGIDIDSPEQLRKWKLAALDVLADAFMSAEEDGKK